jgi:uncharacterized protein YcbX
MASGTITELWRYPVKSMRGQRLEESDVTQAGIIGDRTYAVVDAETGKVCSAKHPRLWGRLLQCQAWYPSAPDGSAPAPVVIRLPDGSETGSDDAEVDRRLSELSGRPVRLTTIAPEGNSYLAVWPDGVMPQEYLTQVAVTGEEDEGTLTELVNAVAAPQGTFFDVAALHLVTMASLSRLSQLQPASRFEVARYRPNIVLEGEVAPFSENDWMGVTVRLGAEVSASVLIPTMRCIMTTLSQGDLPRDNEVLRTLSRHNRIEIPGLGRWSCLGAYANVEKTGRVAAGERWVMNAPRGVS